ncbi:MAG: cell division protein FtsQ/DivIB [Corticimicrobacter sp.]|uniref:cell division protein FtsQ/DivIB n=1 Tax=Corticimicrobacter sp. TaxID=2678536 RepID=UPI0032DBEE52
MWNEARTINLIANALTALAILLLAITTVGWLVQRPAFQLSAIELEAGGDGELRYVSEAAVRAATAGRLQGNFFTVDLDATRELFETVPWVRRASVRRVWPNILRVQIEEHQPFALWNENQMINTWGEAFTANQGELDDDQALPQLAGPEGTERLVVQRYAELARWFEPLGLQVQSIALSPRYAWQSSLSNGLLLNLGRDPGAEAPNPQGVTGALPFAARIRRFVQAWPVVQKQLGAETGILQADLRYPNGFALTLADPPATQQPKNKR